MKITKVRTLALSRMHEPEIQWVTAGSRTIKADCAIVVVETDQGLQGIGEASAYGGPKKIADWVDWLATDLVGREINEPDLVPHPTGRGRAHDAAAGGISAAIWDLRGKEQGKPLCALLGAPEERYADGVKVKVYASSGCRYDWRKRPEQLIEEALEYVEQGFPAMKFRVGTSWDWDGVTVDRFLGLVRELSQAVDGRMDLALDGNCRLTEEQAMPIALELDRLGFAWFEEPIPRDQLDAWRRLNSAVSIPVTGGEVWSVVSDYRGFIDTGAADIVQPDVGFTGVEEWMRISRFAESRGVSIIPHSWHNGLMGVTHAHLISTLQKPIYVELCMIQGPLQWAILADPPKVENGVLSIPPGPGLGVELASGLPERFPYVEGHYAIVVDRDSKVGPG
jgi:L-alanine-DL-glutamate epimerase-like enolase superfamily enzyme